MLDSRIYTFLEVCRTLNYTRASVNLHITQPAVTQHIRYLEELYQVPLVEMRGKKVCLTEQGKLLERLAASMCADELHIQERKAGIGRYTHCGRVCDSSCAESVSERFSRH